MSEHALVVRSYDDIEKVSHAMVKSGFFKDVRDVSQAIVKVLAGQELGLPPFAAMTGIHIVQGKPVLGSNLIATLVKNDPRYDYRILSQTDEAVKLQWFESGQEVGLSMFTLEEAKRANLTGKDNWKKYPSDMLFARAISRGARRFAPGIFGGAPIYTPDEFDLDVDPDGYVDAQVSEIVPEPAPTSPPTPPSKPQGNGRPWTAHAVRDALKHNAQAKQAKNASASDKQTKLVQILLSELYAGDDDHRHTATNWLFGQTSTKLLLDGEILALLDWMKPEKNEDGQYIPSEYAIKEAQSILTAALKDEGQGELL